MIPDVTPMRFTPRGLVDAFDSTDKFPGACQQLTNLIFDQSNPERVICRSGVVSIASLASAGFSSPGFISVHRAIGTRIYGMCATQRNVGKDEPFVYDTVTGAFITVSGVTGANCPTSPATNGSDWTPPTIDMYGTMVIVTHPGFNGVGSNFFGMFNVTNPAAPAWNSFNTATNLLPSVPTCCANFNNRMWFGCGNQTFYTDVLTNPPTITNASQSTTVGNTDPINAMVGLPVQTSSAGIVQTLYIFKATTQIWQISGDPVYANLLQSYVSLNVGTNSPRSIAQSPLGIYFTSSGGPYFINPIGALLPVTNNLQEQEPDIQVPFQNAKFPTRWSAAYNSVTYRVCGQTTVNAISGTNDYWFDEHRRRWNGPHSFQYDCASPLGSTFILTSYLVPGVLMQHSTVTNIASQFNDLGTPIVVQLVSSTLPKVPWMSMKQMEEAQIELSAGGGTITYSIVVQDDQGNLLDDMSISVSAFGKTWGSFIWGGGVKWGQVNIWGGGGIWGPIPVGSGGIWGMGLQNIPHTYPVPFEYPVVFEKMQLSITATPGTFAGIGTFYGGWQRLGYITFGQ